MALIAIGLGAATFIAAHLIEAATWSWFSGAHAPWFLNSGRAVAFTAACFFTAGALTGAAGTRGGAIRLGVLIGLGGVIAAAFVLFWRVGAGTLFPIAIAVGALVLIASSAAGVSTARALRRAAAR